MRGRADDEHTVNVIKVWISWLVNANILALGYVWTIAFDVAGAHVRCLNDVVGDKLTPQWSDHRILGIVSRVAALAICRRNCQWQFALIGQAMAAKICMVFASRFTLQVCWRLTLCIKFAVFWWHQSRVTITNFATQLTSQIIVWSVQCGELSNRNAFYVGTKRHRQVLGLRHNEFRIAKHLLDNVLGEMVTRHLCRDKSLCQTYYFRD